jgi:ABC-2 type transport system ATP-binding protein
MSDHRSIPASSSSIVLELSQLSKLYGDTKAVQDLDLRLPRGEIYGLLGPNGAGKTTTFKMIVGLLTPSQGTVRIGDVLLAEDPVAAKRKVGFVPDTPLLYEKLTAREFIHFVGDLYGVTRATTARRGMDLLRLFDLGDHQDDLIDSFSHGMKQKTALAAALVHRPELLVLDEPTVGLDPKSARLIKNILRQLTEQGVTVLLSTHILEIAERMCDRIGIISQGQLIAEGSMSELQAGSASEDSLEDIFLELTGGTDYAELAEVLA